MKVKVPEDDKKQDSPSFSLDIEEDFDEDYDERNREN